MSASTEGGNLLKIAALIERADARFAALSSMSDKDDPMKEVSALLVVIVDLEAATRGLSSPRATAGSDASQVSASRSPGVGQGRRKSTLLNADVDYSELGSDQVASMRERAKSQLVGAVRRASVAVAPTLAASSEQDGNPDAFFEEVAEGLIKDFSISPFAGTATRVGEMEDEFMRKAQEQIARQANLDPDAREQQTVKWLHAKLKEADEHAERNKEKSDREQQARREAVAVKTKGLTRAGTLAASARDLLRIAQQAAGARSGGGGTADKATKPSAPASSTFEQGKVVDSPNPLFKHGPGGP